MKQKRKIKLKNLVHLQYEMTTIFSLSSGSNAVELPRENKFGPKSREARKIDGKLFLASKQGVQNTASNNSKLWIPKLFY